MKDVKWRSLRDAPPGFVYVPMLQPQTGPDPAQSPQRDWALEIRVRGDAAGLVEPVRREIRAVNAEVEEVKTQSSLIDATLKQERLLAKLSGFFGAIGLMLAAVGLYGLMAYTVSRRTSEMGIRMALGARPVSLVRMVLRESAGLVLAGVVLGTAAAYGVTGMIEKFLFGVTRS